MRAKPTSAGARAAAPAGGAASRRRAATAIRTPRSGRSSCSPIWTPIRSWSRNWAALRRFRRWRRRADENGGFWALQRLFLLRLADQLVDLLGEIGVLPQHAIDLLG